MPDPNTSDSRLYWAPSSPLMFSGFGFAGSLGGFNGSRLMWQVPQAIPIRNGGSTEPSISLFFRESGEAESSER